MIINHVRPEDENFDDEDGESDSTNKEVHDDTEAPQGNMHMDNVMQAVINPKGAPGLESLLLSEALFNGMPTMKAM